MIQIGHSSSTVLRIYHSAYRGIRTANSYPFNLYPLQTPMMLFIRLNSSIPILNCPIQPRSNNLARLLRMPLHTRNRPLRSLHLMPHLTRLPIPEAHISTTISGSHKLTVWTTGHIDGISCIVVTLEDFLSVLSEFVVRTVDEDVVIGGLIGNVFAGWVC